MAYEQIDEIKNLINNAHKILILQADNPDGDSLASSLALEQILGDLGKEPVMFCGIDMPSYLHYLSGWDRVSKDLPNDFDLSIIVDCSQIDLFDSLARRNSIGSISSKPCLVLDHHSSESSVPFASLIVKQPVVSTGELIYEIAKQLNWPLNQEAKERIATSILSDSQGLMTEATTPRSIHIIAELVEGGVKLAVLDNIRRELMRKSPELVKYKGELLQRVQFHADDRIATVDIPWEEIEKYSQAYNPSMLVIDDMRLVENTQVAIAYKIYNDGKITAKIRANYGYPIANKLAEHFGGGGHAYASGFKIEASENKTINDIKADTIRVAVELIDNINQGNDQSS